MAAAAASHVAWLSATATQAADTAAQAQAAAAAYEAAFASTVPPEVVAANRTLLMTLIATNFFGQNTPAIAATEAQYAEMWAQDAAAMYGYAGSSAAATALAPFTLPQRNTNAAGPAGQAAAVNQAAATPAGNVQSAISFVPQALSAASTAAPAQAADPLGTLANLISVFVTAPSNVALFLAVLPTDFVSVADFPIDYISTVAGLNTDHLVSGWNGEEEWPSTAPAPVKELPAPLANLPTGTVPPSSIAAGMGEADAVGGLSVPQAWTVAAPEIRSVAYTVPAGTTSAAAASAVEASSGSTFSQLGLAGMAGPGMAGAAGGNGETDGDRTKIGPPVSAQVGGATADAPIEATPAPRTVVTGVAARIREITRLRDEGRLTEEEYTEQKNRLLGR
jgi:PPE-repeat protein